MANVNNASVAFVIDARNGAVARASLRFRGGKVCTANYQDEGVSAETMSIAMIAQTIADLEEHGVPRGGAIIIAADRPLRRVFEIRKAFNGLDEETKKDLDSAMEEVINTVIKPWMIEQNAPIKDALKDLVGAEVSWLMNYSADRNAHDISFMRSHNVQSHGSQWSGEGWDILPSGVSRAPNSQPESLRSRAEARSRSKLEAQSGVAGSGRDIRPMASWRLWVAFPEATTRTPRSLQAPSRAPSSR